MASTLPTQAEQTLPLLWALCLNLPPSEFPNGRGSASSAFCLDFINPASPLLGTSSLSPLFLAPSLCPAAFRQTWPAWNETRFPFP
jgi:hypothetical protein